MTFKHDDPKPALPVTSEPEGKASHDTLPPPALLEFMLEGWKTPTRKTVRRIKDHASFSARRAALSGLFPGETLVIPTGHEKVRANDTHYRFRPGTDFYYLTGNQMPDCVLVLEPAPGGKSGHRAVLYLHPNPGRSNATFYTDRKKGELWVGARLGLDETRQGFALDECRPLEALDPALRELSSAPDRYRVLRGMSELIDQALANRDAEGRKRDQAFAAALSELRLIKDAQELRELRRSIDSTHRGFEDVIATLPHAVSERQVEGVFNLRARVEGNDVGYNTIAASGPNACILHWERNDGAIRPGTLLLLDAGVEGQTLYTADITRTLPVNGRFTPAQREIYELVHAAQAAAFAVIRPGADFMDPNRAAMRVLAEGLERLGILRTSAEEALREEHQFYKRYSLHNVSHMLGLDVHDCAAARAEAYKHGKLKPGMVFTVEPGLYFQLDDLTVPAKYRGIGVRIEDDVVVTARGYRNLSAGIPSEATEVERWMARVHKTRASIRARTSTVKSSRSK